MTHHFRGGWYARKIIRVGNDMFGIDGLRLNLGNVVWIYKCKKLCLLLRGDYGTEY